MQTKEFHFRLYEVVQVGPEPHDTTEVTHYEFAATMTEGDAARFAEQVKELAFDKGVGQCECDFKPLADVLDGMRKAGENFVEETGFDLNGVDRVLAGDRDFADPDLDPEGARRIAERRARG